MYEYDDPSLGQAYANILRGIQNPQQWQQVGQGIINTAQVIPNVAESLVRGGVGQAIGTMGDLRDLRNTVQSYLPQSIQNWSNAAEFMTNPYAKALIQTAPTTEQTLEAIPRATAPYEGFKQHETLGEFIAPSLGYFGGKALKAGKNLPVGLSIEDVTPPAKVAEALRQPEKNALGFYSPLEEAVLGLKNEKGTGQQYLAQLLKTQGVKQEEVATRGLDTFLNENPKVSKEQLINYLRENPVELKETVLQEGSKRNLDTVSVEDYRLGEGQPIDDPEYIRSRADDIVYDYEANNPDIVQLMRENSMEELGFTPKDLKNPYNEAKFQQYVKNRIYEDAYEQAKSEYWDNPYNEYTDEFGYRVVGNDDVGYHITDPEGRVLPSARHGVYDIDMAKSAIRDDALERGLLHFADDEYGTKYHDYILPNGENYREVLIQYEPKREKPNYAIQLLPQQDGNNSYGVYKLDKAGMPSEKPINTWFNKENAQDWIAGQKANYKDYGNYESGHFDEPNILAHFRTTDRTIDGKKTLFVEEIQSDWHQQGRKKGYKDPAIKQEYQRLEEELQAVNREAMPYFDQGLDAPRELVERKVALSERMDALERQQAKAVPDAPFKKNWQELAMKRAMQMAAEGGYDRVAFTTGKQQADRYNLAKTISELRLSKNGELHARTNQNPASLTHIASNVTADNLSDYVGKEAAKKLMEAAPNDAGAKNIKGVDLEIGGEGMKGFYDKILPDFINKYGKKHGLKVGTTSLKAGRDTGNFNEFVDWAATQDTGIPMNRGELMTLWERYKEGQNVVLVDRYMKSGADQSQNVHYFDLTPEAKESFLKKGQPMFAVAPALAITDEDSRREVLEKLFNSKK